MTSPIGILWRGTTNGGTITGPVFAMCIDVYSVDSRRASIGKSNTFDLNSASYPDARRIQEVGKNDAAAQFKIFAAQVAWRNLSNAAAAHAAESSDFLSLKNE